MSARLVIPAWLQRQCADMAVRHMKAVVRTYRAYNRLDERNPWRRGTVEHAYFRARQYVDSLTVIEGIAGASYPSLNQAAARMAMRMTP